MVANHEVFCQKTSNLKKNLGCNCQIIDGRRIYRCVICANVLFSIQYVDECWNSEHHYNILYYYFGTS